ncbi:MAG: hypothetical protein M3R61_21540, partial [Chloroflexota bacterium]|nr:hypothetical protein [Chloroflexota bacterium]
MAFLSTAQNAAIRVAIDTDEITVAVYRNPIAAGGKTGARTLLSLALPIRIRPAGEDDSNMQLIPLANPLNATRVGHI